MRASNIERPRMNTSAKNQLRSNRGATLIETILVTTVVAVGLVAAVSALSDDTELSIRSSACTACIYEKYPAFAMGDAEGVRKTCHTRIRAETYTFGDCTF